MSTFLALAELNTWPSLFEHPRSFNRETQNKTYPSYLDEYQSESDSEDNSSEDELDDRSEADGDDGDPIPHDAREISEACQECFTFESPSAIRRLTSNLGLDDQHRIYLELQDVAGFVELSIAERLELGEERTVPVAFVCDQTNTVINGAPGVTRRQIRRSRRGFTRSELQRHLSTPRFRTGEQDTPDVDRREIYLPNLDAPEIETLASMVNLSQRDALSHLLLHHFKLRPSIAVKISPDGFKVFNLYIHLPFFALRRHKSLRKDPRKRPNGYPLRESWHMNCIPASTKGPDTKVEFKWCLYDAQRSMTLVGIDDRTWTVIGIEDTFFDEEEPLGPTAHRESPRASRYERHPISRVYLQGARGCVNDVSLSDSRMYFFTVLSMWMRKTSEEYNNIATNLEEAVNSKMTEVARNKCPMEASGHIRDLDNVLEHLPKITNRVSQLLRTWQRFERENLGYFNEESKQRYLPSIWDSIYVLEDRLQALQGLDALAKSKSESVS